MEELNRRYRYFGTTVPDYFDGHAPVCPILPPLGTPIVQSCGSLLACPVPGAVGRRSPHPTALP